MNGKALIVAAKYREAHDFATKVLGLKPGRYIAVHSLNNIQAVIEGTIYLCPGWEKRHDRFSLESALRFTRLEVVDVAASPDFAEAGGQAEVPPEPDAAQAFTDLVTPAPEATEEQAPDGESIVEVAEEQVDDAEVSKDEAIPASDETEAVAEVSDIVADPILPKADEDEIVIVSKPALTVVPDVEEAPSGQAGEAEQGEDSAPAEKQSGRRRSRCKECDLLHYKDESCPPEES